MRLASRVGLIEASARYDELGKFADEYLDGNRGIIAHVLWYIRKRYCHGSRACDECPLFYSCFGLWKTKSEFKQVVQPKLQNPIPENREWIKLKFARYSSNLKILKKQPARDQSHLTQFIKSDPF
jgi:hypothetical protein